MHSTNTTVNDALRLPPPPEPCCYVFRRGLKYAVLKCGECDASGVPNSGEPYLCQRAYGAHMIEDRVDEFHGPVAVIEAPMFSVGLSFAAEHAMETLPNEMMLGFADWQPLLIGDVVICSHWNSGDAISRRSRAKDPYDATIPSEVIETLSPFRVSGFGRLDTVFVQPLPVDRFDEAILDIGAVSPVVTSVSTMDRMRKKRCELRKVVRVIPTLARSSATPSTSSQALSNVGIGKVLSGRVKTLLSERLSGMSESLLAHQLSASQVKIHASGGGIGHATHQSAMTMEDVTRRGDDQHQ